MASSAPDHLRTPGLISNRPCYEGINLLFEAGKALLVKSGLVCWDEHAFIFAPKYQSNDDTAASSEGISLGCCFRLVRKIW